MKIEQTTYDRKRLVMPMLVGLGTGIAATILYAAFNERRFNRVTGRVRHASDRAGDYVHRVESDIRDRVEGVAESAKNRAKSLAKGAHAAVDSAEASIERVADSARRAIDTHAQERGMNS